MKIKKIYKMVLHVLMVIMTLNFGSCGSEESTVIIPPPTEEEKEGN